jgi:uncharacterized membrane protein YgcG
MVFVPDADDAAYVAAVRAAVVRALAPFRHVDGARLALKLDATSEAQSYSSRDPFGRGSGGGGGGGRASRGRGF